MSDLPVPTTDPTATTRRTVLRAAGLAALTGGGVAVLGACTAEGETGTPASSAPATSPSSAPASSSAPAESPSPSTAKPTPSKAPVPEGPSVATAKVPVRGGVILDDADYVITQPKAGEFKAFSKICTHQNCPVTGIEGRTINCQCHGSKFSIEDGSVQTGPATRPLPEAKITVAGDQVVVTG